MKILNKTTISTGWLVLLALMGIAHLMGKSLATFQPILLVWLVFTILHWWRIRSKAAQSAVIVEKDRPKK